MRRVWERPEVEEAEALCNHCGRRFLLMDWEDSVSAKGFPETLCERSEDGRYTEDYVRCPHCGLET